MMRPRRLRFRFALPLLLVLVQACLAGEVGTELPVRLDPLTVRDRSLSELPASTTRVDLEGLPASESDSTALAGRAANFFAATNDAHSFGDTYALRGLTNTPIFGRPSVATYLDDLPLGQAFTFPTDFAGFGAAALHRGSGQNTHFGRAGSAGVLTLFTPDPGNNDASGDLRASYGTFHASTIAARMHSAYAANTDAYTSAAWSHRDGFVRNAVLGHTIDDKDSRSALARLRFRPAAGSELTLLVTALRARDGVQPLVPLGGPLFDVARSGEGLTHLDALNAALTASFATRFGRLRATTSHNFWDLSPYASTLAFGPVELANHVRQRQRTWNEEIRFDSTDAAALRWQFGIFGSAGRTDGAFDRFFGPFPFERSGYRVDATETAAFGEATAKVSPALHVVAGLRVEATQLEMRRDETAPTTRTYDLSRRSSALLPKLGLSYEPAAGTSLLVSAGAGFKPGGFSAFTGDPNLASFGPERTRTLEAGLTRAAADQRASATIRVFWYEITGYQIERSFATGAVADDYLVVNAPRARSIGGELELSWRPFTRLVLAADVGVTRVTLREFTDPYTGVSYAGKSPPFVPAYDINLRADYRDPRGWFASMELSSNGRTFYTEDESPAFAQRAVTLVSASIGRDVRRGRIALFARNLTDEGYFSAITPGTGHGTPGRPRRYGGEFVLRF